MNKTWPQYFATERAIRACAMRAGIPKERATVIASDLMRRPLPRARAWRLLSLARTLAATRQEQENR